MQEEPLVIIFSIAVLNSIVIMFYIEKQCGYEICMYYNFVMLVLPEGEGMD